MSAPNGADRADSSPWFEALRTATVDSIPTAAVRPAQPDRAPCSAEDLHLPERMGGRDPTVSVVIPTYTDADYLPDALESVGAQTMGDLEAIVVDSSRKTWVADLADARDWIRYEPSEPAGVSAARNRGIGLAEGKYVAFLDVDDYWHPEKLARQFRHLGERTPISYTGYYFLNHWTSGDGEVCVVDVGEEPSDHAAALLRREIDAHISTLVCRQGLLPENPFDEGLRNFEDVIFAVERFREHEPARVGAPLAVRRLRPDSLADRTANPRKSRDRITAYAQIAMQYPEFGDPAREMIGRETYRMGIAHLQRGETIEARRRFRQSIARRAAPLRAISLCALTYLPVDPAHTFERLAAWYPSGASRGTVLTE